MIRDSNEKRDQVLSLDGITSCDGGYGGGRRWAEVKRSVGAPPVPPFSSFLSLSSSGRKTLLFANCSQDASRNAECSRRQSQEPGMKMF